MLTIGMAARSIFLAMFGVGPAMAADLPKSHAEFAHVSKAMGAVRCDTGDNGQTVCLWLSDTDQRRWAIHLTGDKRPGEGRKWCETVAAQIIVPGERVLSIKALEESGGAAVTCRVTSRVSR